jgi:tetratricopeptide (TPR) repeat protein
VLDDLMEAFRAQGRRDYRTAVQAFQRLLAENPAMGDAWENLAQCLHQLGRFSEAVDAFRRALEVTGGADHVALGLARLYLEMAQFPEARSHAELALATNPVSARQVLARVALAEGDLAAARGHAEAALEGRANAIRPLITLAQVAVEEDDLDRARQFLARAEEEQAKRGGEETSPGLLLTKGDILARLGRASEAESSFLQEIEQHPEDSRAYARLALLYALQDRPSEAVAVLRQLVEENETPPAYAAAVEALQVLGDRRGADALLRHALRRFPDNPKLKQLAVEPG